MRNEKQETIEDIVAEIREAEKTWARSEIAQLPTQYLKVWADRIEAVLERAAHPNVRQFVRRDEYGCGHVIETKEVERGK